MNEGKRGIRRSRKWWALNAAAALALALAVALMLNLLARRYPVRSDWNFAPARVLSDQTLALLEGIKEDIRVVACFRSSDPLFQPVKNLLRDYSLLCPCLQAEMLDPDRDLARAKELAPLLLGLEPNVVVFSNSKRNVVLRHSDLAAFDDAPMLVNRPRRMLVFKGESAFSGALQRLGQEQAPVVYFLAGHGERALDDFDPAGGYSDMARLLRNNNLEPRSFFPGDSASVPSDAAVLVVAGPRIPLLSIETDMLREYLERGGRLMLLLDSGVESGLDSFLAEWGARVEPLRVVDKTITGREILVRNYARHPALSALAGITTVLNQPSPALPSSTFSLSTPTGADRPSVSPLLFTSAEGFATPDFESGQPRFNRETDIRGPLSLALAVERGPSPELQVELAPARMVVLSDSSMIANGAIRRGYNTLFFMAVLDWLMERGQTLPTEPRPPDRFQIIIPRDRLRLLFVLWVVVLPGAPALAGLLIRRQRARRFLARGRR